MIDEVSLNRIWCAVRVIGTQHNPMVTAGSFPPVGINFGEDEPGMTQQSWDIERGYVVWRNYTVDGGRWTVDGESVKSPVDIDALPAGVYRLV